MSKYSDKKKAQKLGTYVAPYDMYDPFADQRHSKEVEGSKVEKVPEKEKSPDQNAEELREEKQISKDIETCDDDVLKSKKKSKKKKREKSTSEKQVEPILVSNGPVEFADVDRVPSFIAPVHYGVTSETGLFAVIFQTFDSNGMVCLVSAKTDLDVYAFFNKRGVKPMSVYPVSSQKTVEYYFRGSSSKEEG